MQRRQLLAVLATPALRAGARPAPRITRIRIAPIVGRFHKFVAMNSYDTAPKGETYTTTLIRIETDKGVEGVGVIAGAATAEFQSAVKALIGADPVSLYQMGGGHITGRAPAHAALLRRYMHLDGPLFDLVGKLTGKPCWQLIGESARERVEVYDGTLYFSDIWFKDRGVAAVVEEALESVRAGYRGLKLKLGRGFKWMNKNAGLARDIEVTNAVRKAVGTGIKILVDANNGYKDDFDRAWRLVQGLRQSDVYWIEEIFPEDVSLYTQLREKMSAAGIFALIADGESAADPAHFAPYLGMPRLVDVVQMDIRRGGFLANLELARMAERAGALSVPHNWGSQVGLLMGLHFSKAVKNATAAEDDRSTCDAIVTEGYEFRNGFYTVSNAPGLGIRVNEDVYNSKYRAKETVIAN